MSPLVESKLNLINLAPTVINLSLRHTVFSKVSEQMV